MPGVGRSRVLVVLALYGDMSVRVNAVYRGFSLRVEIYSIDESFLDLSDVRERDHVSIASDVHLLAIGQGRAGSCPRPAPLPGRGALTSATAPKTGECVTSGNDSRHRPIEAMAVFCVRPRSVPVTVVKRSADRRSGRQSIGPFPSCHTHSLSPKQCGRRQ